MVNKTQDEIFPVEGVHELFDALPGPNKRLMFWEGKHDDWPTEAIDYTVAFHQLPRRETGSIGQCGLIWSSGQPSCSATQHPKAFRLTMGDRTTIGAPSVLDRGLRIPVRSRSDGGDSGPGRAGLRYRGRSRTRA